MCIIIRRSIVSINHLTPLQTEDPILKRYYGKSKKFTVAVQQMKTVLTNISKEREVKKRTHKEKTCKVVLKRLTQKEIDFHTKRKPGQSLISSMKLRSRRR